jgi:hypothetical protein
VTKFPDKIIIQKQPKGIPETAKTFFATDKLSIKGPEPLTSTQTIISVKTGKIISQKSIPSILNTKYSISPEIVKIIEKRFKPQYRTQPVNFVVQDLASDISFKDRIRFGKKTATMEMQQRQDIRKVSAAGKATVKQSKFEITKSFTGMIDDIFAKKQKPAKIKEITQSEKQFKGKVQIGTTSKKIQETIKSTTSDVIPSIEKLSDNIIGPKERKFSQYRILSKKAPLLSQYQETTISKGTIKIEKPVSIVEKPTVVYKPKVALTVTTDPKRITFKLNYPKPSFKNFFFKTEKLPEIKGETPKVQFKLFYPEELLRSKKAFKAAAIPENPKIIPEKIKSSQLKYAEQSKIPTLNPALSSSRSIKTILKPSIRENVKPIIDIKSESKAVQLNKIDTYSKLAQPQRSITAPISIYELKPTPIEKTIDKAKIKSKPVLINQIRPLTVEATKIRSVEINKVKPVTIQQIKPVTIQTIQPVTIQKVKQVTIQKVKPLTFTKINIPYTYKSPPTINLKPSFKLPSSYKSSSGIGYEVEIRRQGRFTTVPGGSLTKSDAELLGQNIVSNSAAASYRLKQSRSPIRRKFLGRSWKSNFYKKGNINIEYREKRIKTPGEKAQITFKGILSNIKRKTKGVA